VIGSAVLLLGVAAAIALYYYADTLVERRLRPATIEFLERRFDSTVELSAMQVRLTPRLTVRAEGITLRHEGRTDIPPIITMQTMTIAAGVRELWEGRIDRVRIDGLELVIPPRRPQRSASPAPAARHVYIGELVAENSLLTIMSKRAGKSPRVFQLRRLRFTDVDFTRDIPFEAALTNPTPHGEIVAHGSFGPWAAEEPSLTPVNGEFVFDADLGTIKGIGGALHAEGSFAGPLELIRTSGRTRTEGFHLSSGGEKFPLSVDYEALVDATNGDTTLERVDGMLGESPVSARGAIVKVEGGQGRRITLDTSTRGGRLEDFVKLTTRTRSSPMTGLVDVDATLDIPPGDAEVIQRLTLDGTFKVAQARFTAKTIQDRVDELSRRGVGRPTDQTIDDVASNFRGSFRMSDARLQVRSMTFSVDGAAVRLAGTYDTTSEALNFKGELRLDARASETQTGWKRLVLKIFDPMLDAPGAGTVLPISITGTRQQPKFAADIKKAILRD
jgi:hypothetical protein